MKLRRFVSILLAVSAMLLIPSCAEDPDASQMGGGNGSSSESDLIGRIADIENLAGYEYIGVGSTDRSVSSRYRSSDDYSSVLVGYTADDRVEELTYLDSSGHRINSGIYLGDLKRLGDYIFLSLFDGDRSSGYNFCIHVPEDKLYRLPELDIEFGGNTDHSVAMDGSVVTFTASDSIYELYAEKGKLIVNELIDLNKFPDFRSFFRDRYENIFSVLDQPGASDSFGHIRKKDGTFDSIELNPENPEETYWLAINGVVYQEDESSRYYYNEAGELQIISADGFYPDRDDFPGNMGDYERNQFEYYTYENSQDFYIIGVHPHDYKKVLYSSVRYIHFDSDVKFTQTGSNIPVIEEINSDGITSVSLDGQMMYILTNSGFYSIDFVNKSGEEINTGYQRYESFWDLGPIGFELQVLDENGNTLSVLIDKNGNEINKEISDYCGYDHFSLSPLN